jgi:hypothetical protein
MIGYFLLNTNDSATVSLLQNFLELNKAFVLLTFALLRICASSIAFIPESMLMNNALRSHSVGVIPTYQFHIEKCVLLIFLLVVILWMGLGHCIQL